MNLSKVHRLVQTLGCLAACSVFLMLVSCLSRVPNEPNQAKSEFSVGDVGDASTVEVSDLRIENRARENGKKTNCASHQVVFQEHFQLNRRKYLEKPVFSPDGRWLAYRGDGGLFLRDLENGKRFPLPQSGHRYESNFEFVHLQFSSNSRWLAYTTDDSSVVFWDIRIQKLSFLQKTSKLWFLHPQKPWMILWQPPRLLIQEIGSKKIVYQKELSFPFRRILTSKKGRQIILYHYADPSRASKQDLFHILDTSTWTWTVHPLLQKSSFRLPILTDPWSSKESVSLLVWPDESTSEIQLWSLSSEQPRLTFPLKSSQTTRTDVLGLSPTGQSLSLLVSENQQKRLEWWAWDPPQKVFELRFQTSVHPGRIVWSPHMDALSISSYSGCSLLKCLR